MIREAQPSAGEPGPDAPGDGEAQLRQPSQEYLQFIADTAATGIAHCSAERRFVFVNQAYAARFGLTPDQIVGRPVAEVLGEEAYESIRPYIDRVLAGETFQYEIETNYRLIGRRYLHVAYNPEFAADGRVAGWVAAITDLTEMKRAEEKIERAREHLQFIADATATGLAHCNAERRFMFVNKTTAERLGLTPDQIVGRSVAEVMGEEAYESIRPYIDRALATGESLQYEIGLSYGAAGWRYMHCAYTPEIDAHGQVVGWVAAITDITDRHQLEEALREADRRKDEFLATLAHELRNPLAPIRNAVQILQMQGPPDPTLQWARAVIDRQAQQLARLVDDLLDVSRISRGKIELRKERVEVSAIVERALETSRPFIEAAGHQLTVTFPLEPLLVVADLTRMAQALSNLLNNAAKYTRAGGHIHLSAGRAGEEAVIKVGDDGVGIPPEMLSRIFELFTQVDTSLERAQGGLGIGLTIARSLVEMHGGRIEAASDGPGHGSEFTVRLPLELDEAPWRAPFEQHGAQPAGAGLRILVVDDNEDSAESLAVWLRLIGHDVRTAYDGPRALETAREYRPDIVLLDIGMPGMSGYDVARRLRDQPETRQIALVAMTGWGQEEDRRRSMEAGFDEHLVKPLDPQSLGDLLARIASRKGLAS
jgi:two-component system, chemotaxis family, CheB/CheR fusion protein